jgi:hypothetical protein
LNREFLRFAPFGRDKGKAIQALTGKFPWQPNREFSRAEPGIKLAEPGITGIIAKNISRAALLR